MIAQKAEDFAMPLIDRDFFFENFAGDCAWNKAELNRLFDFIDSSDACDRTDSIAYILATIRHECGQTMLPTKEETNPVKAPWLKGKYLPYMHGFDYDGSKHPVTGHLYFGRGYTQNTWYYIHKKIKDLTGHDIVNNPDLLLVPEISWQVTELFMSKGFYTGKKLSDYFNDTLKDFSRAAYNARSIINPYDHADLVRDYFLQFFYAIRFTK